MSPHYCTINIDGLLKKEKLKLAEVFLGDSFEKTKVIEISDWSFHKSIEIDNEEVVVAVRVKLEYDQYRPMYFGNCVLLLFSPSNQDSINYVKNIINEIDLSKFLIIIVELHDLITHSRKERKRLLKEFKNFTYFKCKVNHSIQVNKIFKKVIRTLIRVEKEKEDSKLEKLRKIPFKKYITIKNKQKKIYFDDVLSLRNRNLDSLSDINSFKNLKSLKVLDLEGNRIRDLKGIKYLKKLKELYLAKNHLTEIKELENLTQLEVLDLSGNQIQEICSLRKLQNLKKLKLTSNKIISTIVKNIDIKCNAESFNTLRVDDPHKLVEALNFYNQLIEELYNEKPNISIKKVESLLEKIKIRKDKYLFLILLEEVQHKGKFKDLNDFLSLIELLMNLFSFEQIIQKLIYFTPLEDELYIEKPYINIEKVESLLERIKSRKSKEFFLIMLEKILHKPKFKDLNDFLTLIELLINVFSFEQIIKKLDSFNYEDVDDELARFIDNLKIDYFEKASYRFDIIIKLIISYLGKEDLIHFLYSFEELPNLLGKSYYEKNNLPSNPTLIEIEHNLINFIRQDSSLLEETISIINNSGNYFKHLRKEIPITFKINDYLTLKLEYGKSNIYVKNQLFNQCKFLLLNIPVDKVSTFDEIDSIDEAAEKLDRSLERRETRIFEIPPEVEFWGHCSNLQVWTEMDYDTRLLHRNIAFPLLKRLVDAKDPIAKQVFKQEIAKRFLSGHHSVQTYLLEEKFLNYLNKEEIKNLILESSPELISNEFSRYLDEKLLSMVYDNDFNGITDYDLLITLNNPNSEFLRKMIDKLSYDCAKLKGSGYYNTYIYGVSEFFNKIKKFSNTFLNKHIVKILEQNNMDNVSIIIMYTLFTILESEDLEHLLNESEIRLVSKIIKASENKKYHLPGDKIHDFFDDLIRKARHAFIRHIGNLFINRDFDILGCLINFLLKCGFLNEFTNNELENIGIFRINDHITVGVDYKFPNTKSLVYVHYFKSYKIISTNESVENITPKLHKWVEQDYHRKFLHYKVRFPLLKELVDQRDSTAERVFKQEIKKGYIIGSDSERAYLILNSYLRHLDTTEIDDIITDLNPKIFKAFLYNLDITDQSLSYLYLKILKRHSDLFDNLAFMKEFFIKLKKPSTQYDYRVLYNLPSVLSNRTKNEIYNWLLDLDLEEFNDIICLRKLKLFDGDQYEYLSKGKLILSRFLPYIRILRNIGKINSIHDLFRDEIYEELFERFYKDLLKWDYYDLQRLIEMGNLKGIKKEHQILIYKLRDSKLKNLEEEWNKYLGL